jgi:hypothetical protein
MSLITPVASFNLLLDKCRLELKKPDNAHIHEIQICKIGLRIFDKQNKRNSFILVNGENFPDTHHLIDQLKIMGVPLVILLRKKNCAHSRVCLWSRSFWVVYRIPNGKSE